MKVFKRGGMIAALAVAVAALFAATASATISPNPYNTSAGIGEFNTTSILGDGSCQLSGITGSAAGTSALITGFSVSNCRGVITAASYNKDITVTSDLGSGTVTANVALLIVNILGGHCLYQGSMTGTPDGTDTVTVSGNVPLNTTLRGLCTPSANASLTVTFPGATIS